MNIKATLLLVLLLLPFSVTAQEAEESPFYGQVVVHDYHGEGSFLSQEAYFQVENDNGIALWVTGYRDEEFWSASTGVSKTWDNGWTAALGVGNASFDNDNQTFVTPWVSYNSDEWEFLLSAEYYQGGYDPYYQGYLQRRVGERHLLGIYGESGVGIGPAFTFGLTERVAFRVVVPVADKDDTKVLTSLIFTF